MRNSAAPTLRIILLALALLITGRTVSIAQESTVYPSARHGGNYMHNYYLPPAPSSTPWAPSWAPDGKSVLIAMSGSIWSVDPVTGVARELTHGRKYHSSPRYSPDGKWIVYTADDGGKTIQLEMLNVATGEVSALTQDEAIYTDPVFSPDGSKLAYVSTRPNGYFNVSIRPVTAGRWSGPEIAVSRDHRFARNRLYMGPWDMHLSPSWFPDGKELLLLSNRDVPLGSGNVLRVPAEENGIERARPVLVEQSTFRAQPDVSPDGTRFLYASSGGAAEQFNNLYMQPTEGGAPYKLTFYPYDAFHPRWSPDGERIAYLANKAGLPQLEILETFGGGRKQVAITKRIWRRPMGTLRVRVEDESAKPTPARIFLKASDGKLYAPSNAYARIGAGGGDPLFFTDGTFSVELPEGPVQLTAMKGFEILPQSAQATIAAGGTATLTMKLVRMTNMAKMGWFNGSAHVHVNYAGNAHHRPLDMMTMSAAEGQNVVIGLVANKDNRVIDNDLFLPGGKPHPVSTKDMLLMMSQEYRPAFWGHVSLLGLRDHILSPAALAYDGTALASYYPSNTDMLRKAKAQGATTAYVHAFGGDQDPLQGELGGAKGLIVDAALGTADAVEWSAAGRAGFFPAYALWNNGFPVYAIGGEDSITDLHRSKLVGSVRTYVFTGARGLDLNAWQEGIRKGKAFVTTGPLVEFTVNGKMSGDTVSLPAGGGSVTLAGRIQSIAPLKKAEIIFNGKVIEELALPGDRRRLAFTRSFSAQQSGWYHLRVEGAPDERAPFDTEYAQAFTNPVWVTVGGRPVRDAAAADYALRWIDKLQAMAEASTAWRSPREKSHVLAQFDEARTVYRKRRAEAAPLP